MSVSHCSPFSRYRVSPPVCLHPYPLSRVPMSLCVWCPVPVSTLHYLHISWPGGREQSNRTRHHNNNHPELHRRVILTEYRRPKIFVHKKFPNTEDRRSSFLKNFRIPKTEDLRSWKISEYRKPKIFANEKFPNTEDRRSSLMKNFRIPKTEYLCSWKISEYQI